MARNPRLEFTGATYHVISRGNYRKALFEGDAAGEFEKTLFQAREKCGWMSIDHHYQSDLRLPLRARYAARRR